MKRNKTLDFTLLVARIVLAVVVAAHGSQKLFGWFGGFGFDGTMGFFTEVVGLPYALGVLIIIAETAGMVALALGFLSRILSSSLILIMAGAIITTHAHFGFFMNWVGTQGGEGFEFHLLAIGLASVVALNGGGSYSVDAYVSANLEKRKAMLSILFD